MDYGVATLRHVSLTTDSRSLLVYIDALESHMDSLTMISRSSAGFLTYIFCPNLRNLLQSHTRPVSAVFSCSARGMADQRVQMLLERNK